MRLSASSHKEVSEWVNAINSNVRALIEVHHTTHCRRTSAVRGRDVHREGPFLT